MDERTASRWGACVLAALLFGCGPGQGTTAAEVPLGVVIDRTGNNSEPSWVEAIKLARRHANLGLRKAGYKNLQFQVVVADSGNEPTVALTRVSDLLGNKKVKALILDTSQNDIAVNRLFYDADPGNDPNVPLICGSCTSGSINNPLATEADPLNQAALRNAAGWNFRSVMSTQLISSVLVRLMLGENNGDANRDGTFKVAFYGSDEAFGKGAAKDLKAFLAQLHPEPAVVVEEIYHPRDADPNSYPWSDDLRKLTDNLNQSAGRVDVVPDFIAVANFAQQQAATRRAYRQGEYQLPMLHYHSLRFSSVLDSLGSLADGAEGVSHVLVDTTFAGEVFAAEYSQLYGVNVVYRDAHYYDAALTLMLAGVISDAGADDPQALSGQGIRDGLKRTSEKGGVKVGTGPDEFARAVALIREGRPIDYEGASGPMDYDAFGNVTGRLSRFKASGGAFVDVANYDCVADVSCPVMP